MKDSDYKSYRMIECHSCRQIEADRDDGWKCWATRHDIDNCIEYNTPMEEPYSY